VPSIHDVLLFRLVFTDHHLRGHLGASCEKDLTPMESSNIFGTGGRKLRASGDLSSLRSRAVLVQRSGEVDDDPGSDLVANMLDSRVLSFEEHWHWYRDPITPHSN
jgi:hypothetical protein